MGALIVTMGVSGCGKTIIGHSLSRALAAQFLEGDDFHPAANIAKMANGTALTDEDRIGWLDNILSAVNGSQAPVITLACSALTPYVQDRLKHGTARELIWVCLTAPKAVIAARLDAREDHFMPPALLDSQLAALSIPAGAIEVDVSGLTETSIAAILERLSALPRL